MAGCYKYDRLTIEDVVARVKKVLDERNSIPIAKPEKEIFTNDLKKGDIIIQVNGWMAEIWDNMRGNTRVANVFGFFEEAGSIYSHDIMAVLNVEEDIWYRVTHTKEQLKCKEKSEQLFGGE